MWSEQRKDLTEILLTTIFINNKKEKFMKNNENKKKINEIISSLNLIKYFNFN